MSPYLSIHKYVCYKNISIGWLLNMFATLMVNTLMNKWIGHLNFHFIVHIYSHLSQIDFNWGYIYLEGNQHITHLDKDIISPPQGPYVASPHTQHHPPPYPISKVRDLGRKTWTVVVWNHQHSLVGRPFEGWTNNCWCFFCIGHFIIIFQRFSYTEACVNILQKK